VRQVEAPFDDLRRQQDIGLAVRELHHRIVDGVGRVSACSTAMRRCPSSFGEGEPPS
jgi:hypothetical protein